MLLEIKIISSLVTKGVNYTLAKPKMLQAKELAEITGTHQNTIYREAKKGNIPGCIRIGNRYLFNEQIILQWLSGEYAQKQA